MPTLNRATWALSACASAVFLAIVSGCSPSTELTGPEVLNSYPETRITSTPPTLTQSEAHARFRWVGHDADGDIVGFQWKMSNNDLDGISVSDTLTFDPSTGAEVHPWRFTTAMDTTFIVTADLPGFEGDAHLPLPDRHLFQHHTFFVRAVDDQGAVDPSPAMVTFTAATLSPIIRLSTPQALLSNYRTAKGLPPSFILGWSGYDPDLVSGSPSEIRFLLKEAVLKRSGAPDLPINSRYLYDLHKDELISFSEPGWSDWVPFAENALDRTASYRFEPSAPGEDPVYYFFALQARDIADAVSLDLTYAKTVQNFYIDDSKRPVLNVEGSFFDEGVFSGTESVVRLDIAQHQSLSFNWIASADEYGGMIMGYRYGWNVEDVDNVSDPGWQVPFGDNEIQRSSNERTFDSGIHTLIIETRDNSDQVTRVRYVLTVVPVPDVQRPLLLVDDVVDKSSNAWPDYVGRSMDTDVVRDRFWSEVLNRVEGWIDDVDEYDTEETQEWGYREAVEYKTILWTTKNAPPSYIQQNFDGFAGSYIWIESYVRNIGNLFLTGSGAVTGFHPTANPGFNWAMRPIQWMYPIIYDANDPNIYFGLTGMGMSFGTREVDGLARNNGLDEFGYRSLGLSTVSPMVPPRFFLADGTFGAGGFQMTRRCAGTKAVILEPAFGRAHPTTGTAFPDTIFVWDVIAHEDDTVVNLNYDFGQQDEFYDTNITKRSTHWMAQTLPDGSPTVVPMWRAYTRYDWILDQHVAAGDTDFPRRLPLTLQTYCGSWGIDTDTGRSRTDGVPLGVVTYQTADDKPGGRPDIIWGFDPHMMQHDEIADAIIWTLENHFGLAID